MQALNGGTHHIRGITMNSIKVDNPKGICVTRGISLIDYSPKGYLEIVKGFNVSVYKKPKCFHLFMMKLFFGWKYKEKEGN